MSGSSTRCFVRGRKDLLRSARHRPQGLPDAHGAGAASPPPGGVAPTLVSAVVPSPGLGRAAPSRRLGLTAALTLYDHPLTRRIVGLSCLLAAISALPGSYAVAQEVSPSPQERARAAAAASRARSGDSEALRSNYVTPGLAGQPITTVDQHTRFTPSLSCQKTATLLELLIQPGTTGDLAQVRISHDRDFDGAFDSQIFLPSPVSGVCANGVIVCNPGTWQGCRSYRWSVGADRAIGLATSDMAQLAGCYCLNNSCGTNLAWGNLAGVLKDLGGGVIGALTSVDPRIGVAQAQVEGPVIRYTGAQTTACTSNPVIGQTRYRDAPVALTGDAQSVAASSSMFQAVKASPAGIGKAEQINTCNITREITVEANEFDDIISANGAFASVAACGEGCRRYRLQGDGNCNAVPPIYSAIFTLHKPDRLISAHLTGIGANDWVQGRVDGTVVGYAGKRSWLDDGLPSGDCSTDGEYYSDSLHDFTPQLRGGSARVDAPARAAHLVLGDAALSGLLEEYARLGGKMEVRDAQARLSSR